MIQLVTLKELDLHAGDTVVTPHGVFVVAEARPTELEVMWLETKRRVVIWLEDSVYGPVEVHRNAT